MQSPSNNPALLLIDVQKGIDQIGPDRNNPQAEERMAELLVAWRSKGLPVLHVRHASTEPASALRPEQPGYAYKDFAAPQAGEPEFVKSVNSAFIGTTLEDYLHQNGIKKLVVVGLTTDHCVSTSVRMAGNFGFDVTLVGDATATFGREGVDGKSLSAEMMHRAHLASLHGEFCQVRDSGPIVQEVLNDDAVRS